LAAGKKSRSPNYVASPAPAAPGPGKATPVYEGSQIKPRSLFPVTFVSFLFTSVNAKEAANSLRKIPTASPAPSGRAPGNGALHLLPLPPPKAHLHRAIRQASPPRCYGLPHLLPLPIRVTRTAQENKRLPTGVFLFLSLRSIRNGLRQVGIFLLFSLESKSPRNFGLCRFARILALSGILRSQDSRQKTAAH
jgi:hypothetical protein